MQFWDIIFWTNDENTKLNKYTTKIAMLWNHFEPIILFLLIVFYRMTNGPISFPIILLYTIIMIMYTLNTWNNVVKTGKYYRKEGNKEIKNSLFWEWNYTEWAFPFYTIFLITLVVLSYENFSGSIRILFVFFIIFTFLFSL